MPWVQVGEVELCYEREGDRHDPVVLLVNGLGGQLVDWDEGFRRALVEQGFSVLRFDNRDAGLSSAVEDGPAFDLAAGLAQDRSAAAYTLDDMADDAAGLLEALGIEAAHVVGVSMGGMIAQMVAARYPGRVRSLCSIMSTTGAPDAGTPSPEAMAVLLRPPARGREEYVAAELEAARVIGSPGFPFDEERIRRRAEAAYDRSFRPAGVGRQLMAIMVSGDRTAALRTITAPTVVVHGAADPLVPPSGGQATAAAIAGAELRIVEGMGHDLPPQLWPDLVAVIAANAARPHCTAPLLDAPSPVVRGGGQ